MTRRVEAGQFGNPADDLIDLRFVAGRHIDVLNDAAVDTNKMVVMAGYPLGKLIARNAASTEVRNDYLGFLEHRQGAVQRRKGNIIPDGAVEFGR